MAGTSGNVSRMDLSPRVRAVCDLEVAEAREFAGRHEYDGKPQDLSLAGVRAGLELHRRNPILHLGELDLACYDRDYAPQEERDAARAEHLAAWPQLADAAVESLDRMSAPVAEALLGGIRGL